ncbi:hypothetical protein NDU88_005465 [Pleurodeles waltl]|uniref:Uncharacterized protein n=1 Tax=Pleurodeles waltl TaxID=8319 RepID=A0AAV7PIL5_PLEWA|nr:hypothetical protein NDU88_005465 [Pleurodeles waltl]
MTTGGPASVKHNRISGVGDLKKGKTGKKKERTESDAWQRIRSQTQRRTTRSSPEWNRRIMTASRTRKAGGTRNRARTCSEPATSQEGRGSPRLQAATVPEKTPLPPPMPRLRSSRALRLERQMLL